MKIKYGQPLQFLIFSSVPRQFGDPAWDTYTGSSTTFAGAKQVIDQLQSTAIDDFWAYIVDLSDGSKHMMQFDNEDLI